MPTTTGADTGDRPALPDGPFVRPAPEVAVEAVAARFDDAAAEPVVDDRPARPALPADDVALADVVRDAVDVVAFFFFEDPPPLAGADPLPRVRFEAPEPDRARAEVVASEDRPDAATAQ